MTYFITGATGFLGRHLLQTLTQRCPERPVLALLRQSQSWHQQDWAAPHQQVSVIEGSVTDVDAWQDDPRLGQLDGIFHLAGLVRHSRRDSAEVYRVNVEGTLAMVRLAARAKCRMVYVSTSGTVGCFQGPEQRADEDAPFCAPMVAKWPYYDSKIKAEQQARALALELGVTLVVVRPPMLLGPGDHRFRSTGQVIRFLRGKLPFVLAGGIHYIDIRDAAAALLNAMRCDSPRPVYHLRGKACRIDEFFADLSRVSGIPAPRYRLPFRVAWSLACADAWLGHTFRNKPLAWLPDPVVIEMAARYWDVSSRYAEHDLGYSSRCADVTLQDTVAWLRAHHQECGGAAAPDA